MNMDIFLEIGDLLYRNKGFVDHAAIYIGGDMVIHNSPSNGTEIISLAEYREGKKVSVMRIGYDSIDLLSQRIHQILSEGAGYNAAFENCEHLATFILFGRKFSPQKQAALIGAVAGILISKNFKKGNWVVLAAIGALSGCCIHNLIRKKHFVLDQQPLIGSI